MLLMISYRIPSKKTCSLGSFKDCCPSTSLYSSVLFSSVLLSAFNVRDEVILIPSIVIIFHIVCLCLSFSLFPSGFLRWEQLRSEWLKPVAGQTARKRKSKYDIV